MSVPEVNTVTVMGEPTVTSERPVRLADALDELVTRVVRTNGGDIDRAEVWELIARWALHQRDKAVHG